MAQHDAIISNASGAAVRADLNNALAALITNSSGSTSPSTTYSYQFWADTTANQLKIRNSANDAWITLMELDGTMLMEDGTAAAPGLAFADDVDTGLFRPAANQLGIATSGVERVEFGTTEVVFNDSGADVNFRVEGDANANLLFVDAGNDRVAIGTDSGDSETQLTISATGTSKSAQLDLWGTNSNDDNSCRSRILSKQGSGLTDSVLTFSTRSSGSLGERMQVDSLGRLLIGATAPTHSDAQARLQVHSAGATNIVIARNDSTIAAGNTIGMLQFYGNDGGTYQQCAEIRCDADLDHANDDKPSRLVFSTTADGASSPSERMRIDSSGNVGVGSSSPAERLVLAEVAEASGFSHTGLSMIRSDYGGRVTGYLDQGVGHGLRFDTIDNSTPTERMRINNGGRVGIGTTSPNGSLHVDNGSKTHTFVEVTGSSSNAIGLFLIHTSNSYTGDGIKFHHNTGATSAMNFMAFDSGHGATPDREFTMRGDGNAYADGTWNNNGADYAEFFESTTGAAIPVGTTVVLENNKVRAATADDSASAIMGVIRPKEPSQASMTIGNTAWNKWTGKYLTDDFDRFILDEHVVYEWTEEVEDGDDIKHSYVSHAIPDGITVPDDVVGQTHDEKGNRFVHYRLNPDYDPDLTYVPREERDEWVVVGLIGQVKILDGQPMNDRWIKMRDVSDAVEEWFIR